MDSIRSNIACRLLALAASGFLGCAGDSTAPTYVARPEITVSASLTDGTAIALETLDVTACGPGLKGEYPDCEIDDLDNGFAVEDDPYAHSWPEPDGWDPTDPEDFYGPDPRECPRVNGQCVRKPLDDALLTRLRDAARRINAATPECDLAKQIMLNTPASNFSYWTGLDFLRDFQTGGYVYDDQGNKRYVLANTERQSDGSFLFGFQDVQITTSVVLHEGLHAAWHALGLAPPDTGLIPGGKGNETWVDEQAAKCT